MTDYINYTDQELLKELRMDSQSAFAELYRRYQPKLHFFILRLTKSRQLTEDALQDVFLKLWFSRKDEHSITDFNAWMFRVARNHVINGLKRMAGETLMLAEIAREMEPGSKATEQLLSYRDASRVLNEAIAELPTQQKTVLLLSREEGLSYEQIAAQLQLSPLTVKKHAALALQFLRRKISDKYGLTGLLLASVTFMIENK